MWLIQGMLRILQACLKEKGWRGSRVDGAGGFTYTGNLCSGFLD